MGDTPPYQLRLAAIDHLREFPTQENYDRLMALLMAQLLTDDIPRQGVLDYTRNADEYMADPTKDHPYAEL